VTVSDGFLTPPLVKLHAHVLICCFRLSSFTWQLLTAHTRFTLNFRSRLLSELSHCCSKSSWVEERV